MRDRIYLSPPHMSGLEQRYVNEAFDTNWIAPLGPNVDGFEREFCEKVGCSHAAALASGTAALHLALILAGVGHGDEVVVSSLTFVASVNPIRYVGATPVLVDSERWSWNMDPELVEEAILDRIERTGRPPKAVIAVHLYGQSADLDRIAEVCRDNDVTLIEDAAEALGATYWGGAGATGDGASGPSLGRSPGTLGRIGVFSFNGNKIITTSGGGMLVSENPALVEHARKLATQARDSAPHYEHTETGFNYRMSNVVAGIGRGQLPALEDRVASRRKNFRFYTEALGDLPGIRFQPEASWGLHTRWLTCLLVDRESFGASREDIRLRLEEENIEARPLWKPMHLQRLFDDVPMYGGGVAEDLFDRGLCLPSGSSLTPADRQRIADLVAGVRK